MVTWELLSVALIAAVTLVVCWTLNAWNRSGHRWSFPGRSAPRGRGAARCRRTGRRCQPLDIRPLPPELRNYYTDICRRTEEAFSTSPRDAIHELDLLVKEALRQCGYPVDTFEHDLARILSAAPQVVEDYRSGHAIALGNDSGIASELDLRLAMFHYHVLLKTLLDDGGPEQLTRAQR